MPAKRKHVRPADWPDHLIERKGYYSWRYRGRELGLGRDYERAKAEAEQANAALRGERFSERLRAPKSERTLGEFLPRFREAKLTADRPIRTRYAIKSHLKAIEANLADVPICNKFEDLARMSEPCATFLQRYRDAGKLRMGQQVKKTLSDVFVYIVNECGALAINPVRDLTLPKAEVKRQRLTVEDFNAIYEVAPRVAPWLARAMELGLVTSQRREDIANMTFRAIEDGRLKVIQKKTGARLRIPLALRLNAVGLSLDDVVKRCKTTFVLSKYLVHHVGHQGRAKPGMRVHPQTLGRAFAEARKLAGVVTHKGKTPPTFHELRSLSIRLYKKQNYKPKDLAGHKKQATTDGYEDSRGADWIDVGAQ